jgi:hypothetical protein
MFEDAQGPINHYSWARFIVAGTEHAESPAGRCGAGKDIRIVGDRVTAWEDRRGHTLSVDMITGIPDQEIEVLVIGNGADGALVCPTEVLAALRGKGIPEVIVARTPEACRRFNELIRSGRKAAFLAHGTC